MKKIKNIFYSLGFIGIVYFVINIGVLIWFLISPEGFWGVFWFYTVFTGTLYLISQILLVLIGSIVNFGKKGILYGILLALLILIPITIEFAPGWFIANKLYSKYKYVERTNEYLERGRYEKALDYAIEVHEDNRNIQSSRFWFLKHLFLNTEKGQLYTKNREYQAKLNYAICLHLSGTRLDLSESLFQECDLLARQYFPDKTDYSIIPLMQLSNLYFSQGRIYESEKLNNKVTSIISSIKEEDTYHVINVLLVKSNYLQRFGDYQGAQKIIQQAHEIYLNSEKSTESKYYLQLLLYYIKAKYENGDLAGMSDLLREAEDIAEDDKKKMTYVEYLNYQARYEEHEGDLDEAKELYENALKRCRRKGVVEHANQLRTNGNYLFRRKEYKEALEHYSKAVEVLSEENYKGGLMPQSQFSGIIRSNYALGNQTLATQQSKAMDSLMINAINQYFMILSQDEREKMAYANQKHFDVSNSIYLSNGEVKIIGNVYNNVLATKSISLVSNMYISSYLSSVGNVELQKLHIDLLRHKKNFENEIILNPNHSQKYQVKLDSISFLEREFYSKLIDHEEYKPFDVADVKWLDIKSRLDSNEVAIEFIRSPQSPLNQDAFIYYALVLNSASPYPKLVKLFYENDILTLLKKSDDLKEDINSVYSDGAESELFKLIWKPLSTYLERKSQVYVSLSGLLNSISITALTIDEPYTVKVLSSTRQIIDLKSKYSIDLKKSLVFGDINYNSKAGDTAQFISTSGDKINPSLYRSIQNTKLDYLKGTRIEINELEELLNANSISTTVCRGANATEAVFRNLIQQQQADILHIATHGFYYPKESSVVMKDNIFNIENDYSVIDNPMLRSGLFFAGVNNKEKYGFYNDGVLIANEIVGFDLSGVELIVLSACETGIGDVRGNEGVFGLQRAFKMAGANKLVMSLWKVSDEETAKLMTKFYEYYLAGDNANEALKKAQCDIRQMYPEPFYWAGFFVLE